MGLGKGGFIGVGSLAIPLMAQVVPPLQAAALLLPLLIAQDVVGVWAFRHSWDRHIMLVLLPSAVIGIGLGYMFAASLSEAWILIALGVISILFAGQRLWIERGGRAAPSHVLPDWVGVCCGVVSGLTSQIAHAGAPPYQLWVMPQRLARDVLVGTTAIFFAAVNWIKVPAYVALGQFTPVNLIASAALLPVAIVATFAGVRLVRRVDADRFYTFIYWLTVLLGAKLLWDGVHRLA
ncbi:sulfite exporter TauE/SafE family protein [Sphingomonas sp. SRS2]|uniref:sulfite exporter TauE/SafE family protein n=1 Tax=Sphingomonas sp. SRS2 TaxID=133190 RepID=UPI000618473D|nr:sulfite exporter TauE/SafE family protein [Sphingomonas sp. SRS2]KKC26503.1 membrane protein [Sphingomonas sp. SRS2]